MKYLNEKTKCKPAIIALLIIFTIISRLPGAAEKAIFIYLDNRLFYAFIYFGLFILWGISIRRRIVQKQTLKFLLAIVGLIIFWYVVRTVKFIYTGENYNIERWCWYTYYIPMLLISLMGLFVTLSLGRLEDYKLPKWISFIYIPTIILIGFVLTNDFHQRVFIFPKGELWTDKNYQYGIVYLIIFAWVSLSVLASLAITIFKSRMHHSKKIIWLPFIPYFIVFIYAFLYAYIGEHPYLSLFGDMTTIFCLFYIAIVESLIQSGLIRSNQNYEDLFYSSNLKAKILNKDNQLCYQTNLIPVERSDNIRISTFPISGGYVLWQEDISEMNKLIKELEEVNQRLAEENYLLQAELELREREIKIEEKTRLYDKIAKEIKPQIETLNNLFSEKIESVSLLRERLIKICVLGTYIKRSSNLFILEEDNNIFSAKELEYCIRESVEAISQGGIDGSLRADCDGKIKAKYTVLAYDLFEEIIEALMLSITALFINLNISKGNIKIKLQINCDKENNFGNKFDKKSLKNIDELIKNGGHMDAMEEDDNLAIIIELPKVGEII